MGTWWPGGERHGKEEADRWDATLDIFWIKNIFETNFRKKNRGGRKSKFEHFSLLQLLPNLHGF
jgi:hypothetical protein